MRYSILQTQFCSVGALIQSQIIVPKSLAYGCETFKEDDWDGRNLLYSLRFNIGAAILIPGCNQRETYVHIYKERITYSIQGWLMDCRVFDGMRELCRTYCPGEWQKFTQGLRGSGDDGKEEEEE
jgi:protein-ribulosamine 3-kinase